MRSHAINSQYVLNTLGNTLDHKPLTFLTWSGAFTNLDAGANLVKTDTQVSQSLKSVHRKTLNHFHDISHENV